MSMMYKVVGDALKEEGLSESHHPQDYLNFYCLGKCEPVLKEKLPANQSPENSTQVRARVTVNWCASRFG